MLGLRLKHLQAVGEGDLVHDKDGAPVDADFSHLRQFRVIL
ncbi:hypothetical protein [Acetobacter pasteurianus]|uniref:Uncharacterized protein n=1 Tax=Acetobacter pasteurianus subsp. pasteurianus TaxID=481145 RepID=A0AAC9SSE3_ACEPA|nr:hypothetical protein [Acetobacter pasteurianus]ASC05342.1 hypothetical protein S101468_01076 [Acetobacter pasteurianus subsp. pasteurianus]GCD64747.1 hypothetical protein NBRC3279_0238 [Acetobacter pasteurianus NBRC 3279]GCD71079.1 hypothetical protein NBRC3284_0235 [Acetobacter pasteurianus NBRC 3284]